jgi:hypothetical protein
LRSHCIDRAIEEEEEEEEEEAHPSITKEKQTKL